METTTYKISDIGEVVGGGTPSTANSDFWGGDIPWISPKDLTGYKSVYISHGESFLNKTGLKSGTKLLPKDTVLFSSRAPIGYVAIASNPICTNQGFKSIICNKEIINPLFLYYYIKGNLDYIKLFGTGVTFPEISGAAMRKIKVQIPSLPTQQKIASILSAYDRLIENNTRRIRLLEQMAENLYKEWFVRFRFPEHENVEMVNGLPKGWKIEKLGDYANISTGKCNREDAEEDGIYPLFDRSQEIKKSSKWIKDCEAIIVPGEGTSFMPRYYKGKFNLHQRCYCIEPTIKDIGFYLFYSIMLNRKYFLSVATGATVPSLRQNNFTKMKLIIAELELVKKYNKVANTIALQIDKLKEQNQLLTRQRDLLLPRLMSGKLEVKS
nr:restriction endonuclease subunit S [uncultured Prevotella sp.]